MHVDLRPNHPVIGMGGKYPDFWITECPEAAAREKLHLAFYANSRQKVREFHALALYVQKDFAIPHHGLFV